MRRFKEWLTKFAKEVSTRHKSLLLSMLISILVLVVAAISAYLGIEHVHDWFKVRFPTHDDKGISDIARNYGLITFAAVGLAFLVWRSISADNQSWASTEQVNLAFDNRLSEQFKSGTEMIGSNEKSLQIAGVTVLSQLILDGNESYFEPVSACFKEFVEQYPEDFVEEGCVEMRKNPFYDHVFDIAMKRYEKCSKLISMPFLIFNRKVLPPWITTNIDMRFGISNCVIEDETHSFCKINGGMRNCYFKNCIFIENAGDIRRRGNVAENIQFAFEECVFSGLHIGDMKVVSSENTKSIQISGCNVSITPAGVPVNTISLFDLPREVFTFGIQTVAYGNKNRKFPSWFWSDRRPGFAGELTDAERSQFVIEVDCEFRTEQNQFDVIPPEAGLIKWRERFDLDG